MKSKFLLLSVSVILSSCISTPHKIVVGTELINHENLIETYLSSKAIRPSFVYNNNGQKEFTLLNHRIAWKELVSGVEISVDGHSISTSDKVTINSVEKTGKDSLNFSNFLQQVKIYKNESLIGFVLGFEPCTGSGCNVNYQIIYDLKTRKQSYFGRYKTGFEFELYDFNNDERLDYVATETSGPSAEGMLAKEYILYSQSKSGEFETFSVDGQDKFWFRLTSNESEMNTQKMKFEEHWIEKINNNGR